VGIGAGLYMYDVVVKSSHSLSHLLMSSCTVTAMDLIKKVARHIRSTCTGRSLCPSVIWDMGSGFLILSGVRKPLPHSSPRPTTPQRLPGHLYLRGLVYSGWGWAVTVTPQCVKNNSQRGSDHTRHWSLADGSHASTSRCCRCWKVSCTARTWAIRPSRSSCTGVGQIA